MFSVCFWHSEGWTPRNEALMDAEVKQARTTRHPWLIACDANMCPEDSGKIVRFQSRRMFIKAPGEEVSTTRSKGLHGELFERTYCCVIASHSLQEMLRNVEVVEDFESRPLKAVTFLAERETKNFRCGVNINCHKRLQDSAVEMLPGRNNVEGREQEGEEEGQKKMIENEVIRGIIAGVPKEADTVGGRHSEYCISSPKSKCWRGSFREI